MSRTRIVGGKITEIVHGDYNIYSASDIIFNSEKTVIPNGKQGIVIGNKVEKITSKDNSNDEENNKPEYIVEFKHTPSYDGEFGFDWMRGNWLTGDCVEGLEELKKIYTPFQVNLKHYQTQKPYGDYYVPWLIMFPNHKEKIGKEVQLLVTAPMEYQDSSLLNSTEDEEFSLKTSNPSLRVEPSKLNMNDCLSGEVITIYCDSPLKNDETITAIASNGAIVGKINVMKNSHYQDLTVNVYVIKSYLTDKNYTNDYGKKVVDNKLSEIGGLQAIKNYLNKKSLNQALIQVNLIDIDEKGKPFDWGFRKSSLEIANKGLDPEFNNDNAPTNIFYTEFKDMLVDKNKMLFDDGKFINFINFQFEKKYKKYINKKSIFLYLTSLNSQDSGGAAFLVPLNNKHCIIFNSNLKNLPSYAHEIGHTFGLTHTFPENNRDYDNKIRIFKDDSELRRQWLIRNERIANIYQVKFEKHHMKRSENIQKSYEKIKEYDIFRFEKSKTDNILDYHNKRISFTQWQIKIMQNEVEKYYNDKE